jgi:hypothetical protein
MFETPLCIILGTDAIAGEHNSYGDEAGGWFGRAGLLIKDSKGGRQW